MRSTICDLASWKDPKAASVEHSPINPYSLLARRAPNRVFICLVLGMLSGMAYALLIPLIVAALGDTGGLEDRGTSHAVLFGIRIASPFAATLFAVAVLFVWASRTWVDTTMTRVTMEATSDLRMRMCNLIASAPLAAIEKIGLPRLTTSIASDMQAIVMGAQTTQTLLIDAVALLGMLTYLAYVDTDVCWFVLKCITVGVVSYQLILFFAERHFFRAARVHDVLQKSAHGLVQGFKELKLSDEKRREYFDTVLLATERELLAARLPGDILHSAATNYGLMLNFLFLGSVTFLYVNYHALGAQRLSSIVMLMLYISVPIGSVISKIQGFTFARVAMRRIHALLSELPQEMVTRQPCRTDEWRSVRFENVAYEHEGRDGTAGFRVGPLSLEFRKEEITFIAGGNGSGKSTLGKLLTLHYHATAGEIFFDTERVTPENMNAYRQSISAIYSDYYLFDRILAVCQDQDQVEYYLKQLGLDQKVHYRNGRFSTLSLSDGQRRRLALVAAFVENRSLYVFDEWAADQDPGFKQVFYREILPSLKAKGKAVVVISHDDRFFDVADKVVFLCEGRVQSTGNSAERADELTLGGNIATVSSNR